MGVLDAWTVACPAKLHPIRLIEIRGHADLFTLANWVAGRQVRIHMNTSTTVYGFFVKIINQSHILVSVCQLTVQKLTRIVGMDCHFALSFSQN